MAIYYREGGEPAEDDRFAGLDDQERQQVEQMAGMIRQANEEQLGQLLAGADQMRAQAPPESQDMVETIIGLVRERLAELGGGL